MHHHVTIKWPSGSVTVTDFHDKTISHVQAWCIDLVRLVAVDEDDILVLGDIQFGSDNWSLDPKVMFYIYKHIPSGTRWEILEVPE